MEWTSLHFKTLNNVAELLRDYYYSPNDNSGVDAVSTIDWIESELQNIGYGGINFRSKIDITITHEDGRSETHKGEEARAKLGLAGIQAIRKAYKGDNADELGDYRVMAT